MPLIFHGKTGNDHRGTFFAKGLYTAARSAGSSSCEDVPLPLWLGRHHRCSVKHGRANGPHVFGKGIYGMLHCYWYYFIVSYSFQVLHSCICGLTINSWQSLEVIDRRVRILRSLCLVVHEFTTQGHFISWRAHLGISIFLRPERECTALMWSRWFFVFKSCLWVWGVMGVMRSDGFHGDPLGQWDPCQQNTQTSKHVAPFFAPGPLPCFFCQRLRFVVLLGQICDGSWNPAAVDSFDR